MVQEFCIRFPVIVEPNMLIRFDFAPQIDPTYYWPVTTQQPAYSPVTTQSATFIAERPTATIEYKPES